MFRAKEFVKAASLEEAYTLNQREATSFWEVLYGLRWVTGISRQRLICLDWDWIQLRRVRGNFPLEPCVRFACWKPTRD